MAAHAFQFAEFEHVSFIRDFSLGFFNSLIGGRRPVPLDHPEQYHRGAADAAKALKEWGASLDYYRRRWEVESLADAGLERRVDRSLALSLESARRRELALQRELQQHSARSHPTREALRGMILRARGEARQIEKDIAAREKAPLPCVGCQASVLCKDLKLACNSYYRFAGLDEMHSAKLGDAPRGKRKPSEATTMTKMPPNRVWFELTFKGSR